MPANYPDLEGRTVFITGGAAGIGAAMVRGFAGQGARVAFVDIDEAAGTALAEETGAAFTPCDIRDVDRLEEIIAATGARFGPVRVLVNNAANDQRHDVEEVTPDYWRERLSINLDHVFFAARAARRQMGPEGGGAIINYGSTNWLVGGTGMIAYQAAKSAIHGITKGLCNEFGPDNIRVNCILPGWVMTERQLALWMDEDGARWLSERQALPGRISPENVADMALFLASDAAAMCSGQFFTVDGGMI
ncbi:SDR family NAD(P)-dependent oxidoreductase [Oceanomicrobium pacificus]|uniref:SDR family oxidoreductase n=1 Tax=Oceanomicrobium pacificus TaxID=2692916 RepID=A0A6B0TUZ3_9RHOB|nr:SDR family oxidoreductase [Oceanomicrobium pacificus]MXU65032.1 SDR family oxidoreductase [Oceanomicrobium pacificus]